MDTMSSNEVDELGIETLDLALSSIHPHSTKEYLRIGVLEEDSGGSDGTASLCIVHFWDRVQFVSKFCVLQANLTESEIDQVIAGLQEAKRRMAIYRGVTPT